MLNMKRNTKWVWVMILTLLVAATAPAPVGTAFAAANDVVLDTEADSNGYDVDESDIDMGDDFTLTVYAKVSESVRSDYSILDDKEEITDVKKQDIFAEISSSHFEPEAGSTKMADELNESYQLKYDFDLVRTGEGNSLTIQFTNASGDSVGSETIYIREAEKIDDSDDDDDNDNTSPDEKDPDLVLDMDAVVQEFVAGEDATLEMRLDVLERTATDVKVTFMDDADDLPFIFEDSKPYITIDKVTKNGAFIEKDISISPLAKSKVYGLKLKLDYRNTSEDKYSREVTLYVKVTNEEIEPILSVSQYRFSKERLIADGGKQAIVMMVKNSGTLEARNIRAELKGFTADGIHIDRDIDTKAIAKIEAGQEEMIYFNIKPAESASTGQYPLTLEITYDDEAGNEYTRTSNLYVPVDGRDSRAIEMTISDLDMPQRINAGDTFEISFKLKNSAQVKASFVELTLEYPNGFVPKSSPKKYIREMLGGDEIEHTFVVMAKEDLESNHYDLYINVAYQAEGDPDTASIKEYAGLGIDGRSGLGRPKILIEDYSFDGEAVMAGESFDLNLRFFNTSSDDIVKNIKVSIGSDDGVFSPVDSSSSFFIERIERQGYHDYVLKLETKRDAQVKTYNLNLVMEYEDGEGNAYDAQEQPYKEEESLGIPVSQPVRLETGEINAPFEAYVGMPADLELEFYNMGRSAMYNMFVKLDGNFRSQDGSYFVGNFESGNSDYFVASVIPEQEGEISGNIVFTFEDALGNPSTVEKPFSFFVAPPPEFGGGPGGEFPMEGDGPGVMGPEGEGTMPGWLKYVLGAAAAAAAVIFLLRRRKKKKEALLKALEDEDE